MDEQLKKVDHTALVINQLTVIVLNMLAFILDQPWLALFVGLALLAGTIIGKPGFAFLYRFIFKPLGIAKPHVLADNPEPHQFAQGFGSVVMLTGAAFLSGGFDIAGWGLVWLVIALAALNVFAGFCVGCFVYYWLTRLKAPGFSKSPPEGAYPGRRPKGADDES
ncbi:MAG: DUF4395 domain-containing protein [Anaerolineales bacterium]|nr:DUF4395 domain-containing protein [Anaerolineales bacterium]